MSDYSSTYPTQSPTFAFDAKAGKLDSRISYSRSSTGTYMSSEKALSSENLLPYSNDLSQSVWTKRNLTVPVTNIVAPDGTSSASSLLETTATSTHDFYEEFSAVSGASYTFTLYAKANGRDTLHVSPQATSTIASVVFDLTAVTSTVVSGSADSHSISAIGSTGWYKLQVTVTATGSGTGFLQTYIKVGGSTSYAGDATKGAYIWGCQVSSTGETVLNETSGSIHREYSPLLKEASADSPRFEFASDGQSEGLLIEQQFQQHMYYTEEFDNTSKWTLSNSTLQPNSAVAPDGTLSADLLVETDDGTGSNYHYIYQHPLTSVSVGQTYTATIYAKAAGRNHATFWTNMGGASIVVTFDLTDGSVTSSSGSGSFSSNDCGNGWYRLQLTFTTVTNAANSINFYTSNGVSHGYTGNGYGSVLLWGANLTETSSGMSYLKAEGSQTTKSADSCSVAVSEFSGFADTEGAIVIESTVNSLESGNAATVALTNAANNEFIKVGYEVGNATDQSVRAYVRGSNADQSWVDSGSLSQTGTYKAAVRYEKNNVAASLNGASAVTDTVATMPIGMTSLYIGSASTGGNALNANVKRVAYYSAPLSDTELQALTS